MAYIDERFESFMALLRGGLGADAEHQGAIDQLRWWVRNGSCWH